ncbi:MAG TPA: ATP-dependent helicase HrpB [Bdellovibrionales bacterium]|nr:ATP-dependent helicase HrpB [Bdellovibrionales bacterium]
MMQALPIDSLLSEIRAAVSAHAATILTATPGAGKTTRLPPELLSVIPGNILVLQPRRMAAVAAAHRIALERGWSVGEEVGYAVRFESKSSARTRLNFVTDALALRRLIDDPELKRVDLVVIDEFHERNLNQDLMLGAVKELQELGREIKLLVMSATLDVERLQRFLPGSALIDVPGLVHPLEIRHAERSLRPQTDHEFFDRMTDAVSRAARETSGDVLVFLPGVGEIRRLAERLSGSGREIVELHGSLPLADQQRVLRKGSRARVILSTNVAEASVTVQGVDFVVDSGLAKVMQAGSKTGFSQLETVRISQFNARQRAGRAARQKAGVCVRLWTEYDETAMPVAPVGEVQRADLNLGLLWLAHLGVTDFAGFSWFDPPPGPLLSLARRSLQTMGAIDSGNRLTELGRKLLKLPLPPRWGAVMVRAEESGDTELAARMVAILNERDAVHDPRHAPTTRLECDLTLRLELLREGGARMRPIREAAEQIARLVRRRAEDGDEALRVRRLLLHTQRDRLCRRRGSGARALMVGGRGVKLAEGTQVKTSEFFIALQAIDIPGQADTTISLACGMSKDFILRELGDEIEVREDIHFDEEKGNFYSRRGRFLDDLPIEEPSLRPVDPSAVGDRMVDVLVDKWDWIVARHQGLKHWMERWNFLAARDSKFVLDAEVIRQALEMAAFQKTRISDVLEQDLPGLLETALGREVTVDFHALAPSHLTAATGNRHRIDYSEGHAAYVEVRLQEMFGVTSHPRILKGSVPVTLRLLGPNYRPVQVTSDLPGFWRGAYADVRKELRARYPKHSWPEDPAAAAPEAKGRRRF